jgi:hypothetical protein
MAVFAVLCGTCAWLAARYANTSVAAAAPEAQPEAVSETTSAAGPETSSQSASARRVHAVVQPLLWLALPACASALLLAATNKITQDLAPVPLLWVVPLTLYLLTFVIAFDRPTWYRRTPFGVALAASVALAAWVIWLPGGTLDVRLAVGGVLPAFFFGCMVLHGELARLRPPTRRLTAYYLSIAAGGARWAASSSRCAAPLAAPSYSEFPIALWACCALAVAYAAAGRATSARGREVCRGGRRGRGARADALADRASRLAELHPRFPLAQLLRRAHRLAHRGERGQRAGASARRDHPRIPIHRASRRTLPTTYYHDKTGVGLVLAEKYGVLPAGQPRRIGVIGLGAGTLAAYAHAGDVVRFYEIDPNVVRIAQSPTPTCPTSASGAGRVTWCWETVGSRSKMSPTSSSTCSCWMRSAATPSPCTC